MLAQTLLISKKWKRSERVMYEGVRFGMEWPIYIYSLLLRFRLIGIWFGKCLGFFRSTTSVWESRAFWRIPSVLIELLIGIKESSREIYNLYLFIYIFIWFFGRTRTVVIVRVPNYNIFHKTYRLAELLNWNKSYEKWQVSFLTLSAW